ncbi:MAG: hypothetical protein IPM56_05335 [Ignavibacteriales bacterium]|nr:MAG: hypothetical protein IPM56_05335 [Ignavibacteriales bacterium]
MYRILFVLIIFLSLNTTMFSQSEETQADSIEIYIVDSFITPEIPNTFKLTFFTSDVCRTKVILDNKHEYTVSDDLSDSHRLEVVLTDMKFATKNIPFRIIITDSLGNTFQSELNEVSLPYELKVESESNFLMLCLFGGTVFLVPSPGIVITGDESYFSLTKEIPLVAFRSGSFTYPMSYFSVEYSHIFNAPVRNYFRVGYKHIFEVPYIEYVSPGINGFTNFKGFNGISPEISLGLFRLFNTFTVYSRYRYNVKPNESGSGFHEVSIGLYSSFFSIYF